MFFYDVYYTLPCDTLIHLQCRAQNFRCKRMSEGFLVHCKGALSNLISCDRLQEEPNPLAAFSDAIKNFYSHYCLDVHTSSWCFHDKVN